MMPPILLVRINNASAGSFGDIAFARHWASGFSECLRIASSPEPPPTSSSFAFPPPLFPSRASSVKLRLPQTIHPRLEIRFEQSFFPALFVPSPFRDRLIRRTKFRFGASRAFSLLVSKKRTSDEE